MAVSKYWSPSSMPMKFRPSWTQATPVLPDPMKQSTTVPPPWTDLDQGLQELHGLLRLVVLLLGVDAVDVVDARHDLGALGCLPVHLFPAVGAPDDVLAVVTKTAGDVSADALVPDNDPTPYPASHLDRVRHGRKVSPVDEGGDGAAFLGQLSELHADMSHKLDEAVLVHVVTGEAGEACRAVEVGVGVLDAGVLFAVAGKQAAAGIWRIYQNEIRAAGLQLPQKVETVAF